MTLIECFDQSLAKNMVGCLHLQPEKLIFLGEAAQMQVSADRFRAFLRTRGLETVVQAHHVPMDKIEKITAVLLDIVSRETQCVIDVTGGDERMLLAVGAMLAKLDEHQRRRVAVQKFDMQTGMAQDCDGDGILIPGHPVEASVAELIALHGGVVSPKSQQPGQQDTSADLEPLWQLVAEDPRQWNRRIAVLEEFESWADSRNQVFLPLKQIRGSIPRFAEKLEMLQQLLQQFREKGIIRDDSRGQVLEYAYTTPLNRYCTLKAGNALEVKTLLEARAVRQQGKPFFQDCQMAVHIDWDGVVHRPYEQVPDTRNEMDLILMRGMTPLFISCKNGDIDEAELYKLHTVASYFGGPGAKKMLIATNFEKRTQGATRAFIQRAIDMDIVLVSNAAGLSQTQWQTLFVETVR